MRNSELQQPATRTLFEKLLYVGIATFFLWPMVQLWSIKAIPLFESDVHLRASVALENLMEEALTKPFSKTKPREPYKPVAGEEDIGLSGRIAVKPHPKLDNMTLIRAQVAWGNFPFRRTMSLEAVRTRLRP
jgi:hypothetical protein